jgi:Zn finger protein HypA/HybF involved in hydrogenase expression
MTFYKTTKYRCWNCKTIYITRQPTPFTVDAKGVTRVWMPPGPFDEEKLVHGLDADFICMDCGTWLQNVKVLEYKEPLQFIDALRALVENDNLGWIDVRCPKCGGEHQMIDLPRTQEVLCPHCKKGALKLMEEVANKSLTE